ncbi:hypothetical protein EV126DRAFT_432321 [Verticillium dahliae]|nr:hypothetical protein EV126DRAFT_432321 [Verticillium dahliae]
MPAATQLVLHHVHQCIPIALRLFLFASALQAPPLPEPDARKNSRTVWFLELHHCVSSAWRRSPGLPSCPPTLQWG